MESCPFCKSEISEELLRFGGNCPHCFHHIPGEEAPTDPGVEPAEAVPSEPQRGSRLWVSLALVALVGVGAWIALSLPRGGAPVQVSAPGEDDFYMVPLDALAETSMVPSSSDQGAAAGSKASRSAASARSSGSASSSARREARREKAGASRRQKVTPAAVAPPLPDPGRGPAIVDVSSAAGPDTRVIPVRRATKDAVLRDQAQIASMVRTVLASYRGQLEHCYNQRLKQDARLRGTWKVSFVLRTDGRTEDVSVRAVSGRSDPELEACMARKVEAWRFRPIAVPQAFEKTYRFQP